MALLERAIDRFDTLSERYQRLISIGSAVLFALSCATWAGWIRWPDLGLLTERQAVLIGTGWNAIWWGFLNPRIVRRRAQRAPADQPEASG